MDAARRLDNSQSDTAGIGNGSVTNAAGSDPVAEETNKVTPGQSELGQPDNTTRSSSSDSTYKFLCQKQALALAAVADVVEAQDFERSLQTLIDCLHHQLRTTRATIAIIDRRNRLQVRALSGQVRIDYSAQELQPIIDAGQAALSAERALCANRSLTVQHDSLAHLCRSFERRSAMAIPLFHEEQAFGAIVLEWTEPGHPSQRIQKVIEHTALLVTPALALHQMAAWHLGQRLYFRVRRALTTESSWAKFVSRFLLASAMTAMVTAAAVIPYERHVLADAELISPERRLLTAPINGFIEQVHVKPGENVQLGDVLVTMDQRELELERDGRMSELVTAEAELRTAMASHDRKAIAVAQSVLERERAMLDLILSRIERSQLAAPITGVVVSGDLTHRVGQPVSRGETLLEIAPATDFDVHLLVEQHHINRIQADQKGQLIADAARDEPLELTIVGIHPVAESSDGQQRFRVRAVLEETPSKPLRPGAVGTARIVIGEQTFLSRWLEPLWQRWQTLSFRWF